MAWCQKHACITPKVSAISGLMILTSTQCVIQGIESYDHGELEEVKDSSMLLYMTPLKDTSADDASTPANSEVKKHLKF